MNKIEMVKAQLEAKKKKKEQEQEKVVKTAETPQPQTPLERAEALRRYTDNKYHEYISAKLLPSLNK